MPAPDRLRLRWRSHGSPSAAGDPLASAADEALLARVAGGTVHAWGLNSDLQLGDGTTTSRSAPVRVCAVGAGAPCASFLSGISAIAAGRFESFVIKAPLPPPPPPTADLSVDLRASSPLLSSTISYSLKVTNHGPAATGGGTVSVRVPGATTAVTSSTCSYNAAQKTASCPVGALASGATRTQTLRATVGLLSVGLPLPATATRTDSTPADPNPANDSDSANCVVVTGLIIAC